MFLMTKRIIYSCALGEQYFFTICSLKEQLLPVLAHVNKPNSAAFIPNSLVKMYVPNQS
jgi:hypothetical protein